MQIMADERLKPSFYCHRVFACSVLNGAPKIATPFLQAHQYGGPDPPAFSLTSSSHEPIRAEPDPHCQLPRGHEAFALPSQFDGRFAQFQLEGTTITYCL